MGFATINMTDTDPGEGQALDVDQFIGVYGDAGLIGADDIADGAISGDKLANGSVSSSKLANGAVTNDKLTSGAVKSDNIDWATLGLEEKLGWQSGSAIWKWTSELSNYEPVDIVTFSDYGLYLIIFEGAVDFSMQNPDSPNAADIFPVASRSETNWGSTVWKLPFGVGVGTSPSVSAKVHDVSRKSSSTPMLQWFFHFPQYDERSGMVFRVGGYSFVYSSDPGELSGNSTIYSCWWGGGNSHLEESEEYISIAWSLFNATSPIQSLQVVGKNNVDSIALNYKMLKIGGLPSFLG